MTRVEIELALHRARTWQLEAYSSLPTEVLHAPATQDEHDPDVWWTPKDHLAHSSYIASVVCMIIRHNVFGLDIETLNFHERIAIGHKETMASIPTMADLVPRVHERTNEMWQAHHDKTFGQVVAMGEESYAEIFSLLASISDEQLESVVIDRGVKQSIAEQLATLAGHDRQHWGWAMRGIADRAAAHTSA